MEKTLSLSETLKVFWRELPGFLNLPVESDYAVEYGTFCLADSTKIAFEFISKLVGQKGHFPVTTYPEFLKLFKLEDKPPKKLSKVDITNIAREKYDDEYISKAYEIWLTKKEEKKYKKRVEVYNEDKKDLEYIKKKFEKNHIGYIEYLIYKHPEISSFIKRKLPVRISKKDSIKHSYITGSSGSGKSETIKVMIHEKIVNYPEASIIIIDPHGDLAEGIAKLKSIKDRNRLIYFDPMIGQKSGVFPVINPLSAEDVNDYKADILTQSLISVFKELLKGKTDLTSQMEAILKPCLEVLFLKGGSNLVDLQSFMKDGENEELINYGCSHSDPMIRKFFKKSFNEKAYDTSKHGIYTKLLTLLNQRTFRNTLTGKSTIDLKSSIDSGKILIFNLSPNIGEEAGLVIGKFIVANIFNIALERANVPEEKRKPVFLYIDECHNFITPSITDILREARKYKLALGLAQQVFSGGDLDITLKDNIIANTRIKASGSNEQRIYKRIERETGVSLEELEILQNAMFHIKIDKNTSIPVRIKSELLEPGKYISSEEWEKVKKEQINKYYRKPSWKLNEEDRKNNEHRKNTLENVPYGEIEEL